MTLKTPITDDSKSNESHDSVDSHDSDNSNNFYDNEYYLFWH